MPHPRVTVQAPSRLHCGLFSFGNPEVRQYGGVGVMIDAPSLALHVGRSREWTATGPLSERALADAQRISAGSRLEALGPLAIEIESAPPQHIGLGSGTQLALSIAAALETLADPSWSNTDPAALARQAGRGLRSAVGLYGFAYGGLIVEGGKWEEADISPLVARVDLPQEWRFVLVLPRQRPGLSGEREKRAFAELPAVRAEMTAEMCREAVTHLVPAAREAAFGEFSESLYRLGQLAGETFAPVQGGVFASEALTEIAGYVRATGVAGVAQSSWGPTLFAVAESDAAAEKLMADLRGRYGEDLQLTVTAANRGGARIESSGQ